MFLTDYHKVWKNLSSSKTISSYHIIQLAIIKAMEKYKDDPAVIFKATHFVYYKMAKAFTPVTRRIKLDNGVKEWKSVEFALTHASLSMTRLFMRDADSILTKEGEELYRDIYRNLSMKGFVEYYNREYVYIFVRQDISPEYQAVQAAHATMKAGYAFKNMDEGRFNGLYFTLVGVPDLNALGEIVGKYDAIPFYEPDLNDQMTAVVLPPVKSHKRGSLLTFKRLVFQQAINS